MTASNHQPRDWDDTIAVEGFTYDVPSIATVDRLITWYEARAAGDSSLALNLDAEGLTVAADANRKRAVAYRQTVSCLKALRERCCTPETEFRGHIQNQTKHKARVRAPP